MANAQRSKDDKTTIRQIGIRSLLAVGLCLLGLGWPRLLAGKSVWIEQHYSQGAYPVIQRAISSITSLLPFSLAEWIFYVLVSWTVALVFVRLIQIVLKRVSFLQLIKSGLSVLVTAGIVLNLFYATWGFNYFRGSLAQRMDLPVATRSVEELETYIIKTAEKARALRATLHEDENKVFSPQDTQSDLFSKLVPAYKTLSYAYPIFQSNPTKAKKIFWSQGLSWQGISGIYIGLTAEPNVNGDQPPLLLYQAAAHEMAHQIGIASENEAEFVGFLACMYSDDPNIQYSGLAYALIAAGNALHDADEERYNALVDAYSDAIWRDFSDYNAYWKAFSGEIRQIAEQRNDAYLKHNAQQSGIQSYGEAVDLLLAYDEKNGS